MTKKKGTNPRSSDPSARQIHENDAGEIIVPAQEGVRTTPNGGRMTEEQVFAALMASWRRDAACESSTPRQRVEAWVFSHSWGRNSGYAVRADGTPASPNDIAADLGLTDETVSKTLRYLVRSGYHAADPHRIVPLPRPQPTGPPSPAANGFSEYSEYMEVWKVADPFGPRRWKAAETRRKRRQGVAENAR